jgi:HSP20 family protein
MYITYCRRYYKMSIRDIYPYDWYKRFMGDRDPLSSVFGSSGIFQEFEDVEREMRRVFDELTAIQANAPKELIREYQEPGGGKVKEVGPLVYGYSMTIGPDGKPQVREFGNVKPSSRWGLQAAGMMGANPNITAEREPLADIHATDKEVKVVLEMPGVKKEDIKVNALEGSVEVISTDPNRKYHKTLELPKDADIETAKSSYNNGILEITFNKKKETKPKGKEIKIE